MVALVERLLKYSIFCLIGAKTLIVFEKKLLKFKFFEITFD